MPSTDAPLTARPRRRRLTALHALGVLLGVGLVVRAFALLVYSTPVVLYYGGDTSRYLRLEFTNYTGLFDDPAMPAGYPAFLQALQAITDHVAFTVGLQHLLGLGTALLLYVALRQVPVPRPWAVVPAAVVALSGDQIFLEQALLTETLWTFVLIGGLAAALRAHRAGSLRWYALAGALIALSAIVRHLSLLVPFLVAGWALLLVAGPLGARLRRGAAVAGAALAVIVVYVGIANGTGGTPGLTELSGFNLYGRTAQFADCDRFEPPARTASLCERTPVGTRGGTFYYTFNEASPLYRSGLELPRDADVLRSWAVAAILAQPLDYLRVAGKDTLRYFAPDVGADRFGVGSGPRQMSFGSETPTMQGLSGVETAKRFDAVYDGVDPTPDSSAGTTLLQAYQAMFRLDGLLLLATILLALGGLLVTRARRREALWLLLVVGGYLLLSPPLLSAYDVRYGVTPGFLFAAAAAVTGHALTQRRRPGSPAAEPAADKPATRVAGRTTTPA